MYKITDKKLIFSILQSGKSLLNGILIKDNTFVFGKDVYLSKGGRVMYSKAINGIDKSDFSYDLKFIPFNIGKPVYKVKLSEKYLYDPKMLLPWVSSIDVNVDADMGDMAIGDIKVDFAYGDLIDLPDVTADYSDLLEYINEFEQCHKTSILLENNGRVYSTGIFSGREETAISLLGVKRVIKAVILYGRGISFSCVCLLESSVSGEYVLVIL